MFWESSCACLRRCFIGCLVSIFVSLDAHVSWYSVTFHCHFSLDQMLRPLYDVSCQPMPWARVHVLLPPEGCLRVGPDLDLCSGSFCLLSASFRFHPLSPQRYSQDFPNSVKLFAKHLLVYTQICLSRLLLEIVSFYANPCATRFQS